MEAVQPISNQFPTRAQEMHSRTRLDNSTMRHRGYGSDKCTVQELSLKGEEPVFKNIKMSQGKLIKKKKHPVKVEMLSILCLLKALNFHRQSG